MEIQARRKVSLTGIKPTSTPHLGNYLGAIRPALRLLETYEGRYFIADYHALTTMRDPRELNALIYDVTATWLACGLDPNETTLYRQSDVPEIFELAWVLSCMVATGQLERGVAYKDATAKGESANAGIFYYPVLMAADIICFDTDVVPIGQDQKQHLELARDMAQRLNHHFGEGTVVLPEAFISDAPLVPGLDGEKMSKSRGNGVLLFESAKDLRKSVMKFVTSSEPLDAPKEAKGAPVFEVYRMVAGEEAASAMEAKLAAGGYGWGHAKQELYEALEALLGPRRDTYQALRADEAKLDAILREGAEKARSVAKRTMARVREAIGIDRRR